MPFEIIVVANEIPKVVDDLIKVYQEYESQLVEPTIAYFHSGRLSSRTYNDLRKVNHETQEMGD